MRLASYLLVEIIGCFENLPPLFDATEGRLFRARVCLLYLSLGFYRPPLALEALQVDCCIKRDLILNLWLIPLSCQIPGYQDQAVITHESAAVVVRDARLKRIADEQSSSTRCSTIWRYRYRKALSEHLWACQRAACFKIASSEKN